MKNIDFKNEKFIEIQNSLKKSLEEGSAEDVVNAQVKLAEFIQEEIITAAKNEINNSKIDGSIMLQRGANALTSKEKEYYNAVIELGGFETSDATKMIPSTVIDRVFEDLKKNRPLLSKIKFENTTGTTEWITRKDSDGAWWGSLTAQIKQKLETAFGIEKTDLMKLTAFLPVAKSMLNLGPEWLDRYVREVLAESIAIGLETAIVDGNGKEQPIGMTKDLKGAVVDGVYPEKKAVKITDLTPKTIGENIMSPLTKEGTRTIDEVILVVNPQDYWEKIFSQTTTKDMNGNYVYGILPINGEIIQSIGVPKGKMIAGMAKDYWMGVGANQKVEYSDEYKFLEDQRTYITKFIGNGKPKDNDSFIILDISGLK